MKRRAFLQALALAYAAGCRRETSRKDGRTVATLWFSYGGKNREVLLDLVKRFNAVQSSVLVEATFQGDYFEALAKLRTALAAKAAPTFSHVVGEVVPYLAEANVLEPLDDYEGAKAMALVPALAQSGAYLRDRNGAHRALVAIPFNRSTPIMYLNGSILEKEGLKAPLTWDELRDTARALTRKGDDARWGYEVPISWWFWVAMVGQAGGTLMSDDGDPTLGGEAGEKALAFWQRLVHEDKVMRPPPGRDYNAWQATNQDFLAGKAAITWTSTAFLRYLEENARFPVVAANLPRDVRPAVPTGGTFFTVLRQAPREEKEAAWSFLRWMCEPDQTIEWATRTGYLPITEPAIRRLRETGYYAKHPNDEVALTQLAYVEPWPWATELFRIQRDVVEPRLERAVFDGSNARTVMSEARAVARARVARSR
ncbi:ABC transporter substrate-binding protein [Pendulispora brunnea]|uniref:ABC transporter substrate-binding protein n=1 Tax=Pendulispora brunnea TaxID=2905690 RepID=A0ABZ2JYL7_9BACT